MRDQERRLGISRSAFLHIFVDHSLFHSHGPYHRSVLSHCEGDVRLQRQGHHEEERERSQEESERIQEDEGGGRWHREDQKTSRENASSHRLLFLRLLVSLPCDQTDAPLRI